MIQKHNGDNHNFRAKIIQSDSVFCLINKFQNSINRKRLNLGTYIMVLTSFISKCLKILNFKYSILHLPGHYYQPCNIKMITA